MVGNIVSESNKTIYVFGVAKSRDDAPPQESRAIGVNLDTGEVDHVSALASEVPFSKLTKEQLSALPSLTHARTILSTNTLAVTAKARSGKDYLAACLTKWYKNSIVLPLGEPIYAVRDIVFGKPAHGKDRRTLVLVGQTMREHVDPDIWIKAWLRRAIKEAAVGVRHLICQDVRQPNEYHFFKSMGATVVKIESHEGERRERIKRLDGEEALEETLLNDETESHFDKFEADVVLENKYNTTFPEEIWKTLVPHLESRRWTY